MSRPVSLKTKVTNERKFVHMYPGRFSLRPKGSRTVQLNDGSYTTIDTEPLYYETDGEKRMGMTGRFLDMNVAKDREILAAFEQLLEENPWMATDVRFQIGIYGEYDAVPPWRGYDHQTADEARKTYHSLPDEARPKLEEMMKYELERVEWDEELEQEISVTDDDKVKMINELARELDKQQKAGADDKVDLA